jgi:hypothetical protein
MRGRRALTNLLTQQGGFPIREMRPKIRQRKGLSHETDCALQTF